MAGCKVRELRQRSACAAKGLQQCNTARGDGARGDLLLSAAGRRGRSDLHGQCSTVKRTNRCTSVSEYT